MKLSRFPLVWSNQFILIAIAIVTCGEVARPSLSLSVNTFNQSGQTSINREIAAAFAPIFYQAVGDKSRGDYITSFDFDGDWRGDNNWEHAEDKRFPLKAYVYYSVAETGSHFFIHYAVFHPRDYKGGERKGAILSELIREGAKRGGKYDPTGLAEETALAHENDLEGCLVVVEKNGKDPEKGRTVYVETLHHNTFSRYGVGDSSNGDLGFVRLEEQRPLLYIEPKGHGIEALDRDDKKIAKKRFLIYKFTGRAEDPAKAKDIVGYELVPIQATLWKNAQMRKSGQTTGLGNATYGVTQDYGTISIELLDSGGRVVQRKFQLGTLGSAFLGNVGGHNMARPPWAWFDRNDRDEQLGQWFFDPARATKRRFNLSDSFSTAYIRLPFWAEGN